MNRCCLLGNDVKQCWWSYERQIDALGDIQTESSNQRKKQHTHLYTTTNDATKYQDNGIARISTHWHVLLQQADLTVWGLQVFTTDYMMQGCIPCSNFCHLFLAAQILVHSWQSQLFVPLSKTMRTHQPTLFLPGIVLTRTLFIQVVLDAFSGSPDFGNNRWLNPGCRTQRRGTDVHLLMHTFAWIWIWVQHFQWVCVCSPCHQIPIPHCASRSKVLQTITHFISCHCW